MNRQARTMWRAWGVQMMTLALMLPAFAWGGNATQHAEAATVARTISVDPSQVVQSDFLGVGVNIIPTNLMELGTRYGYNDAYWAMDANRIEKIQPKVARVWFQIDWMEPQKGTYTFNSDKMKAFYKYMDALKTAGTEVELNFGWKVGSTVQSWFNIPGLKDPYVSAPADLDAYAVSASAALNELLNQRGYTNIKYLTFYNEPNGSWDFEGPSDQKAYYAQMVQKVHNRLIADGLRNRVEIWGPEETGALDWMQYMKNNADSAFDAYTFHVYGTSYDGLGSIIADRHTAAGSKPVVMTEFGWADDGANGSNWNAGFANSVIRAANDGLRGALMWQMNGAWTSDPDGDTNGTYTMWHSLPLDRTPRKTYYAAGFLNRYIPEHSQVLKVNTGGASDVRASAFRGADGNYTVLVESKGDTAQQLTINFGSTNVNKTFYKLTYRDDVQPNAQATLPVVENTFAAQQSFTDNSTDTGYHFSIYTTAKPQTQVEVTPIEKTVTGGQTLQLQATAIDAAYGTTSTAAAVTEDTYGAESSSAKLDDFVKEPDAAATTADQQAKAALSNGSKHATSKAAASSVPQATAPYAQQAVTTADRIANSSFSQTETVAHSAQATAADPPIRTNGQMNTNDRQTATAQATDHSAAVSTDDSDQAINGSIEQPATYESATNEPETVTESAYTLTATNLTWTVLGSNNGTITSSGLYTAPDVTTERLVAIRAASGNGTGAYGIALIKVVPRHIATRVDAPTFSLTPGIYNSAEAVFIETATDGAQIRYTLDGTTPTASSTLYSNAVILPNGGTRMLKAIAIKSGLDNSGITSGLYKTLDQSAGPDGYQFCAYESKTCAFNGQAMVAYGADGIFKYKTLTNGTLCTNEVFGGDPAPNTAKRCFYTTTIPDEVPVVTIFNTDFEKPEVGSIKPGPFTNGWTFDSHSGIQRNGSAFGAANAPSGQQTAYLKTDSGTNGTMLQQLNFPAGTYKLSFQGATRSGYGVQTFDVYVDSQKVGSFAPQSSSFSTLTTNAFTVTAGKHTVKFVATSNTGDHTAFLDKMIIREAASTPDPETPVAGELQNGGFETPTIASNSSTKTRVGPFTSDWTFDSRSGIQGNGSVFAPAANAPEGTQTAYLKTDNGINGTIQQQLTMAAGTYKLNFKGAKRTNLGGTQTFDVYIDNNKVGTFAPNSGTYANYTTNAFTVTAGQHTIRFAATSTTGDNTAFIDDVKLIAQ
ncbi:chitobiase/beta-hexosaminidase C-terminal domain-containing protein [Paenibacillus campi]|uniref:chitobiase/beta-hexosaminidase C-terminal domain-containing protein n=1 Tax=Paenibacillus campi TaxID=3106031 RepID=UPI002AFE2760|nr:chitobiase/beta-hexosaminidase C-terminal domain-containing protein [Paenibacillus sp. SGZ-1014]